VPYGSKLSFLGKSQKNRPLAEKLQDRKSRKNKRGDRKGESNESPEIADRRVTSNIPGLHTGQKKRKKKKTINKKHLNH